MLHAQGQISFNDVRARILRIPSVIRKALPSGVDLAVLVEGESAQERLTLSTDRAYGVTDLFRRQGVLRSDKTGMEVRTADVYWAVDEESGTATITITPKGDWTKMQEASASSPVKLQAAVDEAKSRVPEARVACRAAAADKARAILSKNPGHLTSGELRQVLRLFNTDQIDDVARVDRFSPGFVGATANKLVDAIDEVNAWIGRLWNADDDAIFDALTEAFSTKPFPSARSMLTMVLHVRDPDRFSPVLNSLNRGYRILTGQHAASTGEQYKCYNDFLRGVMDSYGLSPHAVDVFLLLVARKAKQSPLAAPEGEAEAGTGFIGFSSRAFEFLAQLQVNNNDTWFAEHKDVFGVEVREPLRKLVSEIGDRFVDAVCPELERAAKKPNTLGAIRKNSFGATANTYWSHYWAAFHRPELKKTEDFQLYIIIHPDRIRFGMSTGSALASDVALFARRLRSLSQAKRAYDDAVSSGALARAEDEPHTDLGVVDVESLAAAIEAGPVNICRELLAPDAVQLGAGLVAHVEQTFRALYPLYALATAVEPEAKLRTYWDDPTPEDDPASEPKYPLEQLLEDTLLTHDEVDDLTDLLEHKRQIVLYGPPGTGKTWLAERLAKFFVNDGGEVRIVQFHPSYGYEDFIEGIRPEIDVTTRQLGYEVKPGIFRRLCDEARAQKQHRFVLIIDEINRGNLPRIFGELLYLLERRGEEIELPVSRRRFSVPQNVYLIGTMNTADHSIALVDVALRRRFHFMALRPDPKLLRAWLKRHVPDMVGTADLLRKLNEELAKEGIDENLRIGHSHFMDGDLDETVLRRIWQHSIFPTLEEYFYGKPKKLDRFRWERFVEVDILDADGAEVVEELDDDALDAN